MNLAGIGGARLRDGTKSRLACIAKAAKELPSYSLSVSIELSREGPKPNGSTKAKSLSTDGGQAIAPSPGSDVWGPARALSLAREEYERRGIDVAHLDIGVSPDAERLLIEADGELEDGEFSRLLSFHKSEELIEWDGDARQSWLWIEDVPRVMGAR